MIEATLPYPPTVNHYWITKKIRSPRTGKMIKMVCKTPRAAKYIRDVSFLLSTKRKIKPVSKFLRLELRVAPPDKKKRDLDNICKALLDALQASGVLDDDFNIWQLYVERCEVVKGGEVKIKLFSIENCST